MLPSKQRAGDRLIDLPCLFCDFLGIRDDLVGGLFRPLGPALLREHLLYLVDRGRRSLGLRAVVIHNQIDRGAGVPFPVCDEFQGPRCEM